MMLGLTCRNLLSIDDLNKQEIEMILEKAELFSRKQNKKKSLEGTILASCFFEPSTRTRLSFETAMLRLGGSIIGFQDAFSTSSQKGESLEDTIRIMGQMADILVIRHPLSGSIHKSAQGSKVPVINAGDGSNEHPTQTLLDLFSIQKSQGKIEGLKIAITGDLKYARTIHSLLKALCLYSVDLYLIAPQGLELPQNLKKQLKERGLAFHECESLEDVIEKIDILYITRIQKERLQGESISISYRLRMEMLSHCKENFKILHPLPRLEEIDSAIDSSPFAYYFEQAKHGVAVRMALLSLLLGK